MSFLYFFLTIRYDAVISRIDRRMNTAAEKYGGALSMNVFAWKYVTAENVTAPAINSMIVCLSGSDKRKIGRTTEKKIITANVLTTDRKKYVMKLSAVSDHRRCINKCCNIRSMKKPMSEIKRKVVRE